MNNKQKYKKVRRVVLIPARIGSKGVKEKNLQPILQGISLVKNTLLHALSLNIDLIILSSDSEKILDEATEFSQGSLEIIKHFRSKALSSDTATTRDLVADLSNQKILQADDCLILLEPTSPFRDVETLNAVIEQFFDGGHVSLVSCCRLSSLVVGLENSKIVVDTGVSSRRQERPARYTVCGTFYVSLVSEIIKNGFVTNRASAIEVSAIEAIDINTNDELFLARYVAAGREKMSMKA